MLSNLFDIPTPNIDHRTPDGFSRIDHNVVVLRHMKGVEWLYLLSHPIENPFINRVRHAVVNQFCQYQSILAFIKHLKGIGRKGKTMADIRVARQHCVDVSSKLRPLVFVDGMCNVCRGPLHLYSPGHTALGLVWWRCPCTWWFSCGTATTCSPCCHAALPRGRCTKFGDELGNEFHKSVFFKLLRIARVGLTST